MSALHKTCSNLADCFRAKLIIPDAHPMAAGASCQLENFGPHPLRMPHNPRHTGYDGDCATGACHSGSHALFPRLVSNTKSAYLSKIDLACRTLFLRNALLTIFPFKIDPSASPSSCRRATIRP
jgi:hypothetical protein